MAGLALVVVSALLAGPATAQLNDATRQPLAKGTEVVESVVSMIRESCIFPDDKLFLRRVAYIESKDGIDPKTYANLSGGIWQVGQDEFTITKTVSTVYGYYNGIFQKFGIKWNDVTYQALEKPLFSGLAAALYFEAIAGPTGIPRRTEDQGAFYQYYRASDGDAPYNFNKMAQNLDTSCSKSNLDLVFVVDTSSSIRSVDFVRAKMFTSDVVSRFTVGTNDVRVGYVTFSTGYRLVFHLNQYRNNPDVIGAINNVVKVDGGTDTDKALEYVASDVLTETHGARKGASKVVVLITDGRSSDRTMTLQAAYTLRDRGVLIFAIGVSSEIDEEELRNVASPPNCTHVILLSQFSDLESLLTEMQQLSCKAPTVLNPGTYSYPCSQENTFQIPVTNQTLTKVSVSDGSLDVYGSFVIPHPNKAFNNFNITAIPAASSVLFISDEDRPLFLSVGTSADLGAVCRGTYSVTVGGARLIPPGSTIVCLSRGLARPCTVLDILGGMYHVLPTPVLGYPSPCHPGLAGYFPYTYSNDRFVYCRNDGSLFFIFCNSGTHFDINAVECLPGAPTSIARPTNPLPVPSLQPTVSVPPLVAVGNPCTAENIGKELFVFRYPPNDRQYIKCTEWPFVGYIMNCSEHMIWYDPFHTCIWDQVQVVNTSSHTSNPTLPPGAVNPCKPGLKAGDIFHYAYPGDSTLFIQCDEAGDIYIKTCPVVNHIQEHWHDVLKTCTPANVIVGPG